MQHNGPFGGTDGVLMWNDLGLENGGCVRAVSFYGGDDMVIPLGAWKNVPKSKGRHGSP